MIDIFIKSLNEESKIEFCIQSCIQITNYFGGTVFLIDSLSDDKTIELAKKYPIKIYQPVDKKYRSCGLAGYYAKYLSKKSDYFILVDGDMILLFDGVEKIIDKFESDHTCVGITGKIVDVNPDENILSRSYAKKIQSQKNSVLQSLPGVGVYRTKFVKRMSYFMNPFLKADEEADVGGRILISGGILKRLDINLVKHFRHKGNSVKILLNKFKRGYFIGPGQTLRYSLFDGNYTLFLKHIKRFYIYLFLIFWWIYLSFIIVMKINLLLNVYILISLIMVIIYLLKKRSFKIAFIQILGWHLSAIGLILGLLKKPKSVHVMTLKKLNELK